MCSWFVTAICSNQSNKIEYEKVSGARFQGVHRARGFPRQGTEGRREHVW